MPTTTAAAFTGWDWVVLVGYLALVMLIAASVVRRREGTDDFFLGGRRIPAWAVAISLVATMQSAATFVGGPQEAFAGNLTYLSTNLAPMLAAIVVAVFFIPAFYRQKVTSVYELIGGAFGTKAQRSASAAFMIGRVFASGARLYIVALPFALITFGDIRPGSMIISILIIAAVAALYTVMGGIRAVIWTDVVQAVVYVGTIAVALWLLWQKLPVGPGDLVQAIGGSDAAGKLTVVRGSSPSSTPGWPGRRTWRGPTTSGRRSRG
jgi:Na+/proline symporter